MPHTYRRQFAKDVATDVFTSKSLDSRLCQICATVAVGETVNQRVTSGLRMRQASQVTVLTDKLN
jgi:hypothetical protein